MLIPSLVFVACFALAAALGLAIFQRDTGARRLFSLLVSHQGVPSFGWVRTAPPAERIDKIIRPFQSVLPRSADEVSRVRRRLVTAGYRGDAYVNLYYAARVLLPLILGAFAFISGLYTINPLFALACTGGVGFMAPDFCLGRLVASRQLKIKLGLPDALDLTVICVEAGLSLDKAVARTAQELQLSQPDIADELNLVGLEQRAGCSRPDAWSHCAERTGVDSVKALSSILVQADKFGTSVGKALRAHSEAVRTQRRQEVEEKAAKTTIKLVFPLVLFIFPSLFVVTLGPSMIIMFDAFDRYLQ